jgi:ATP-dependent Clp protease ATP-binding subunit ClpC
VGSDLIRKEQALGFATKREEAQSFQEQYERMKEKVLEAMKRVFRPEFINRLDAVVVFHPLTKDHIRQIVEKEVREVEKRVVLKGIKMELTEAAKEWLGEKGYDPVFGARPLRRLIETEIEDRLSEAILAERFREGDTVRIDVQNGEIVLINASQPALA